MPRKAMAAAAAFSLLSVDPVAAQTVATPDRPTGETSSTAGVEQVPPTIEFIDSAGKPLSPEAKREAEALLARQPLPTPPRASPETASGARPPLANDGGITVTAIRPRGSVAGPIAPTLSLSPLELRAYGTDDLGSLIEALGPQLGSIQGREAGRPVVLLNGRRVSNFAEIARIPTEAIERTEVFPEELALQYGFASNQKVVNIVTLARYDATTARLRGGLAAGAQRTDGGLGGTYFGIAGDQRLNVAIDASRSGAVLEADLGLVPPDGPNADDGTGRTLLPALDRFSIEGTASLAVSAAVTATLNGRYAGSVGRSRLGRSDEGLLEREIENGNGRIGVTLDGALGSFSWTTTGNLDRITVETTSEVGRRPLPGQSIRTRINAGDIDLLVRGPIGRLPAGPVSVSFAGGAALRDLEGASGTGSVSQLSSLSRRRAGVRASLDVPISRRDAGEASPLGNLSANVNVAVDRMSDAGSIERFGYGAAWSPVAGVNVVASVTQEEGAPTLEQLGNPVLSTPGVRIFDLARNALAEVTRVTGGNPLLDPDERRTVKIGIDARPIPTTDLVVTAEFVRARTDDPVASLPFATPALEAAFPNRFARDAAGSLTRIDATPLNLVRSEQDQLRFAVNFVRPLGRTPPGMEAGRARFVGSASDIQSALPPGAIINRVEPGSAAAERFEAASSRLLVNVQYVLRTRDRLILTDGGDAVDLLAGGSLDGRPAAGRHTVQLQLGAFRSGIGGRLTAAWASGARIDGPDGTEGLRFSPLATVGLTAFAEVQRLVGGTRSPAWARGLRLTITAANLFDARPAVRDRTGGTPFPYQAGFLDPLGRTIGLELRKLF